MMGDQMADQAALATGEQSQTSMRREKPEPKQARKALVSVWTKRIQAAKQHWEDTVFKRMREDMKFAQGLQWHDQTRMDDERYVANLTLRHLSNKTADLYAKNPKATAERRERLDFQAWDGRQESLMEAMQQISQFQQQYPDVPLEQAAQYLPQLQQAQTVINDAQQGVQKQQMMDSIGKTLELVYEYQLDQQIPNFKVQMKQLVRRTLTTGVGYLKLGFHRVYERRPDQADRVTDVSEQLALVEQQMADLEDGEIEPYQHEAEELRETLEKIQNEDSAIVREGLDLDFPPATSIIIDPKCRQLQGFIGARWVAQEFLLTLDQIKRIYEVDLQNGGFSPYDEAGNRKAEDAEPEGEDGEETGEQQRAKVWELYDRSTGLVYCIADGYGDFLEEPRAPYVKLEQFFPFFVLEFNALENEEALFPPSDVTLMRDMQMEHNIARQRLREHRDANRPKYGAPQGKLSEQDKTNLQSGPAHSVIELQGLQPNEAIESVLQPLQFTNIDPNLYEVGSFFEDVLKVEGTQEASMGGTSGATATESSIAAQARSSNIASNVDDLDDFLTNVAHGASHILLTEMSEEKVREIAGDGAVWPSLSANEIAQDLWLTVRAGSSGRPDRAQEIQNFERLAPLLMQIPGISPSWMAREAAERLDDRIDLSQAYVEGMPSINAMNAQASDAMKAGAGAEPTTDEPTQQGDQGGDNAERQPESDTNMGPNNDATGPQGPSNPQQQTMGQ